MPIKVTCELSEIINLQDFTESYVCPPSQSHVYRMYSTSNNNSKKNPIIFLSDNVWVGKQWKSIHIMRNSCKQHPKHELLIWFKGYIWNIGAPYSYI